MSEIYSNKDKICLAMAKHVFNTRNILGLFYFYTGNGKFSFLQTCIHLNKNFYQKNKLFSSPGFVEMMSAYFPDFSQIETGKVCEWIFELANETSKKKNTVETKSSESILK